MATQILLSKDTGKTIRLGRIQMKEYKVLIGLSAECEDDLMEILEVFDEEHACEIEWWTEVSETHRRFSKLEKCVACGKDTDNTCSNCGKALCGDITTCPPCPCQEEHNETIIIPHLEK